MQIIHEEFEPLDSKERSLLKRLRNKKQLYILAAYIGIAAVFMRAYFKAKEIYVIMEDNVEDAERAARMLPFVFGFAYLMLTIFMLRFYITAVLPLGKDLKKGMKKIISFYPESYKTPYFDNFYLNTAIRKHPMLRIDQDMYDAIQPGTTGFMSKAPYSNFILSLKVGNAVMEFNEKNTIIDR